jgi:hypothetical protein
MLVSVHAMLFLLLLLKFYMPFSFFIDNMIFLLYFLYDDMLFSSEVVYSHYISWALAWLTCIAGVPSIDRGRVRAVLAVG